MRAYSEDLRRKIVDAIGRGMPKAEAARTFGVGISTVKRYATKARRGEPLQVPRNRGKNTTLLASISLDGMGETMAVEGSTDRGVFEAYVDHALAPTLQAGQMVIMDNLPAHKPARVRELIEERGCGLIYLPAYSPDLDPIEEAFAKIKG